MRPCPKETTWKKRLDGSLESRDRGNNRRSLSLLPVKVSGEAVNMAASDSAGSRGDVFMDVCVFQ